MNIRDTCLHFADVCRLVTFVSNMFNLCNFKLYLCCKLVVFVSTLKMNICDTVDFRNFIVFCLGRDPGTSKSDIVSTKTSTINLFGFETQIDNSKIEIMETDRGLSARPGPATWRSASASTASGPSGPSLRIHTNNIYIYIYIYICMHIHI